ncbi:MAG: Smr/MutS family protein [Pyrinomonadaceae bacterium]
MEPDRYSEETPFEIEITDTFDLHSFRPEDVHSVVRSYLDEACAKGFQVVRLIHGKGIGVQREIVRSILKQDSRVKGFRNGDEFSGGGSGATVVFFHQQG